MKGTIMTYPHASREPALSALNGIRRVGAALRTYAARIPTSCGLCQGRSQGGRLCLYCHDAAVRSMAGSAARCVVCCLALTAPVICADCSRLVLAFDRVLAARKRVGEGKRGSVGV